MDASYPRFIRRVKAALIDSFIIAMLVVFGVAALAESESVPSYFEIFIILLPVFIIEPLLVALTGGSPGHHLFNIKIREKSEDKKLSIRKSVVRFFLKAFLGLISIILVSLTHKHLMLHDIVSGSIVDFKSPELTKGKRVDKKWVKQTSTFLLLSILTLGVLVLTYLEYKEIGSLMTNGVVTRAEIEHKYRPIRDRGKIQDYFKEWEIVYSFTTEYFGVHTGVYRDTGYVTKKMYDKYNVGDIITITYNPNSPRQSSVGDLKRDSIRQTSGKISFLLFSSLILSAISLFYLFYILFHKRIIKILNA